MFLFKGARRVLVRIFVMVKAWLFMGFVGFSMVLQLLTMKPL